MLDADPAGRLLRKALLASLVGHVILLAVLTGSAGSRVDVLGSHVLNLRLSPAESPLEPEAAAAERAPEPGRTAIALADASPRPRQDAHAPGLLPELEHYYRGSEVDKRAEPLNLPDIHYPESALQARIEGSVTLRLLIDRDGVLRDASVVSANPAGIFESEALKAARSIRFIPAARAGRPVASVKLIEVPFFLDCLKTGSCVQAPQS